MPIIQSLLDIDYYKFTMGQMVYLRYRDVPVTYALANRSRNIQPFSVVDRDELREELDYVQSLRLNTREIEFLRASKQYGENLFQEDYLQFLRDLKLPEYSLIEDEDGFELVFQGPWATAIYWETLALSVITELYYRNLMREFTIGKRESVFSEGRTRLEEKIRILSENPEIQIVDFGTRRRFSREWQHYVDQTLAEALPKQFAGTSSTESAMLYGLIPIGTFAHELYMVMSSIMNDSEESIRYAHNKVLEDWWSLYGRELSIAVTDTFGSAFFFRDMSPRQARDWKGLRHDSGDPFAFGERAIRFYEFNGLDPREKLLIFSDGLDLTTILGLEQRFRGRIKRSYGWGTNLTNDVGLEPISIVVKAIEADGVPTVKLSDDRSKTTGKEKNIKRFMKIFDHRYEPL